MDNLNIPQQTRWPIGRLSKKKAILITAVLLVGASIAAAAASPRSSNNAAKANLTVNSPTAVDTRADIQPAKSSVPINKSSSFNVKDDSGRNLGKIEYSLDNAELRNEIVVKGERATAVKGRTFLIINIKLQNANENTVTINTRDYIRLSVNGNTKEWLAPDIYNDPVEIQAISTKFSRVGFPINDTDANLKLQVGEISGDKTTIDLKFPR